VKDCADLWPNNKKRLLCSLKLALLLYFVKKISIFVTTVVFRHFISFIKNEVLWSLDMLW